MKNAGKPKMTAKGMIATKKVTNPRTTLRANSKPTVNDWANLEKKPVEFAAKAVGVCDRILIVDKLD